MDIVDGNALAGTLSQLFAFEATEARARCNNCGHIAELGELVVYLNPASSTGRCRSCGHVLLVFVQADGRRFVNFTGMGAIEF
ncbi:MULTISPECIES: DUF6510 family protein [unclassified Microbacterium]|uniref:DUF6510 family protein n=1 Tax=unclassified Microbacterium TaxID=2609290 RepID=UPI0012F85D0E|nr:DUF6510 family protein [Microbacterium sp. MAH-37]MVQ41351.1 hypothetical protein [Microbacterium sp. MAH-37]